MICTVTPTIMDGVVVRWYFPNDDMAGHPGTEPALSASRSGVRVGTFLHLIPDEFLDKAKEAHRRLSIDCYGDLDDWATHERKYAFGGPLVPIKRAETTP